MSDNPAGSESATDTKTATEVGGPVEFTAAKRRGRPPSTAPGDESAAPVGGATATAPTKARGRPKKKTESSAETRTGLARQIAGLHLLAGGMLGLPELALTENEALALSNGMMAVCDEYGLSLSGKTGAALQLFAAAAMIYAPRYFAVQARVQKAQKDQQLKAQVEMSSASSV